MVSKFKSGIGDVEIIRSVEKHGGGGKYIQDMSMDDQKEFTSRMTSAKSYEEQRKIIDEFKTRYKR